jgi:DNA-binding MarR family transcriptional regulator
VDQAGDRARRDGAHELAALIRVSGLLTGVVRDVLGAGVRSNLQVRTLFSVERHPGARPTELATSAGVLLPSMSRVLATLTRAGLVESLPDPEDLRVRRVSLTQAGVVRVAAFRSAVVDLFRSAEMAGLAGFAARRSAGPPMGVDEALFRLAEAGRRLFAETAEATGGGEGTLLTYWALATLHARATEPRPASLADWLCVSRPTMTEHLNRLEHEGLVRRLRPEGSVDGRAVELALTPRGAHLAAAMVRAFEPRRTETANALTDLVAAAAATAGSSPLPTARPHATPAARG